MKSEPEVSAIHGFGKCFYRYFGTAEKINGDLAVGRPPKTTS